MTPSPRVAVSMKLLSLLQCLTLECHVSAQGFVSAVDEMNHSFFKVSLQCVNSSRHSYKELSYKIKYTYAEYV